MIFNFSPYIRLLFLGVFLFSNPSFAGSKETDGGPCGGSLVKPKRISIIPIKNGPLDKSAEELRQIPHEEAMDYLINNSLVARLIVLDVLYSNFFKIMILRATNDQISNYDLKNMNLSDRRHLAVKIDREIRKAFDEQDSSMGELEQFNIARLFYGRLVPKEAIVVISEALRVAGMRISEEDIQRMWPGEISIVNLKNEIGYAKTPSLFEPLLKFLGIKTDPLDVLSNYALTHAIRWEQSQLPTLALANYSPEQARDQLYGIAHAVLELLDLRPNSPNPIQLLEDGLKAVNLQGELEQLYYKDSDNWMKLFRKSNGAIHALLQEADFFQSLDEQSLDFMADFFESLSSASKIGERALELNRKIHEITEDVLENYDYGYNHRLGVSESQKVENENTLAIIRKSSLTQLLLGAQIKKNLDVLLEIRRTIAYLPIADGTLREHRIKKLVEEFASNYSDSTPSSSLSDRLPHFQYNLRALNDVHNTYRFNSPLKPTGTAQASDKDQP